MDSITGLPKVPYNNSYWRVVHHNGLNNRKIAYIELRAKKTLFFGLYTKDWLVREQVMLELTKPEMIKRAKEIIDNIKKEKLGLELLGDYPPKSIL